MGATLLGLFIRFVPCGAFIAPIIGGLFSAFIAFIRTPIGAAAVALVVGIWWGSNRGEERAGLVCDAEKRAGVEAAREIDRAATEKLLAKMREDNSHLIKLRDQDNAEDAAQIAKLEADIKAGNRKRCPPTDDDARRLRLK